MFEDKSQEEVQELTIKYLKKELSNPRLTEMERNAFEKELATQEKESVKLRKNIFKRVLQQGGEDAEAAEEYATGIPANPFARIMGGQ